MSRHVQVVLGEVLGESRSEYESEVADFRQTAVAHLRIAASFSVERFSAFYDAVIEQFKR